VEDAHALLGNNFVFQQDGALAYGVMRVQVAWQTLPGLHLQGFVAAKQPGFKSARLLRVGAMLEEFNKLNSKPQNTSQLKIVLQKIWDKLSDKTIRKAITGSCKRMNACVKCRRCAF